ncbi:MAG: flagellar hook-length control protein FliK, partial [Desulfovibrio sp.]|nr:flagellar hook-length control protein FliK [Desulfovibrio sp.]
EIQLHPQELGAIAVTLNSRNGEVHAKINCDNKETMDLIAAQVDKIKASLEEQGIKIENIEVEMRQEQNNDYTWDNLQHHNNYQQEDEKRSQLRRLRNLSKINESDKEIVAQNMQQTSQEKNASRLLDRVA